MSLNRPHVVHDNLNGRVSLTDLERSLIQTPSFLRLYRIQQLGMAQSVFPGATHTRAAHSIGVMHLIGRITERLGLSDEEQEQLRLAALLHDIGHYPLSHCIELVYRMLGDPEVDPAKTLFENAEVVKEPDAPLLQLATLLRPSTGAAKDKAIAGHVLRLRPDVRAAFRKHDREHLIDDVARIIAGEHSDTLYSALMNSDYDCDRLDYVRRDSHLAGVVYGNIDLEYLIENLRICTWPATSTNRVLAVSKRKSLVALEHYLMARYYIYSQVVFHRTIRSLELIAKAVFIGLAKRGFVYKTYRDILNAIPTDDFLGFDDSYFFAKCWEYQRANPDDPSLGPLIRRIADRRPLRLGFEFRILAKKGRDGEAEFTHVKRTLTRNTSLGSIAARAGLTLDEVVVDAPVPLELVPIAPEVPVEQVLGMLEKASDAKSDLLRAMRVAPRLIDDNTGEITLLVGDPGTIVHHLADKKLFIIRAYTTSDDPGAPGRLEKAINQELG
jgi:uncharacterized protein